MKVKQNQLFKLYTYFKLFIMNYNFKICFKYKFLTKVCSIYHFTSLKILELFKDYNARIISSLSHELTMEDIHFIRIHTSTALYLLYFDPASNQTLDTIRVRKEDDTISQEFLT